jgi:hypothetical protein
MKSLGNVAKVGDVVLSLYFSGHKITVNKNELSFNQGFTLSTVSTNHIYLWGIARGLKEFKIEKPGKVLEIILNSIDDTSDLEGFSHIVVDMHKIGIEIFRLTNLDKKLIAQRFNEIKNGIITISSFKENK